jgi:cysteine desulfurase
VPYLDFNATAPLHPAARQAWLEAADRAWHNPSSLFPEATVARQLLDDARDRLADLLDCGPERIVFTAGATEANNAFARHVGRTADPRSQAVLSAIEHPCVADAFAASMPGRIVEVGVDGNGVVTANAIDDAIGTALAAGPVACVSVMAASNEIGVIQPWDEIAAACRRRGVPFHTDAAQWFGKLPAASLSRCDWITGSGHKFGGPKGVGFLIVPEGDASAPTSRSFHGDRGGPQERGRRAGTENVAAIAAMVAALEAAEARTGEAAVRAAIRDAAERRLREHLPQAIVIGAAAPRLWNTLAVYLAGFDAKKIVARLGRAGVAASTGSACAAGAGSTARSLAAIGADRLGIDPAAPGGMVRLSAGWDTTAAEWTLAIDALIAAVRDAAEPPPRVPLRPLPGMTSERNEQRR